MVVVKIGQIWMASGWRKTVTSIDRDYIRLNGDGWRRDRFKGTVDFNTDYIKYNDIVFTLDETSNVKEILSRYGD
jgi:hypothetical protein